MFTETRKTTKGFSDLLDYFALVGDGIVLLSSGVYVAGWEFTGHDMDSLSPDECYRVARRLATKLQFGSGWTVQCDLIRNEHQEYCPVSLEWPDAVSFLIEQERRARFTTLGETAPRLSRYFLSLSYEPAVHNARHAAKWLFEDGALAKGPSDKALAHFETRLSEVEDLLKNSLLEVRRLQLSQHHAGETTHMGDDYLRFIRRCITAEDHPFAVPDPPCHLNQYLATDDLTGGTEPLLGDPMNELLPGKHIAVLAIDSFPDKSFSGILRELDSLPFDFRYCQQAQLLDEQEASDEHKANKHKWKFKKGSPLRNISPIKVGMDEIMDPIAAERELDARNAMSMAEHGREIYARYSAKVILMESNQERLHDAIKAVTRVVRYRCGFGLRLETVNAVAAWLASFPGQYYKDSRTTIVSTDNLVHMMPLSAPSRGLLYNPSSYFAPHSPPLFYGVTSGGTPYRFHPYVGNVGHTLIAGPTDTGKTTFMQLAMCQFFRYQNAQVFAFDKKKTLYTLCRAMGGDFYDISPNNRAMQLCPLQDLDTESDRDLAIQWIELILTMNDVPITPLMRNEVKETIVKLSGGLGRSLTDFYLAVPSPEIKEGLKVYLGGILDGEQDAISMSRFVVFEMDELYRVDKKTMNGALFYIFARIRRRLHSGTPTLVTVDEFREALQHPLASRYFDEFLHEGRKLNMAVWVVLHELDAVLTASKTTLGKAVLQQCLTRVSLSNAQAVGDAASEYQALGMNDRDREVIAEMVPKSEYYVTAKHGVHRQKRLIGLELGQVALAFMAHSNDEDRTLVDSLIEREGHRWPAEWLRLHGLGDWARWYEELTTGPIRQQDRKAASYA